MEGRVKCGKVNCDQHEWLCRQAGIRAYPTVRFYSGAKRGNQQVKLLFHITSTGMTVRHRPPTIWAATLTTLGGNFD